MRVYYLDAQSRLSTTHPSMPPSHYVALAASRQIAQVPSLPSRQWTGSHSQEYSFIHKQLLLLAKAEHGLKSFCDRYMNIQNFAALSPTNMPGQSPDVARHVCPADCLPEWHDGFSLVQPPSSHKNAILNHRPQLFPQRALAARYMSICF